MPTRTHTTIHSTCLHCGAEEAIRVPIRAWRDWTHEGVPARHALRCLPAGARRWLTQQMCPTCYQATVANAPADYYWEGACAGCGRWETFAVSDLALTAHHSGELTDSEAFPTLNEDQRCMIDMHCHVDCYSDAVYGRPPGEPSPFAAS